jgi:hypothetical protein
MGAGILPTALYKGKIWFLFGKENRFETSAPGFSDFGGGTEIDESQLDTAIREGGEELTGFLGSDAELRQKLAKSGTYTIDIPKTKYRTHLLRMEYDPHLEKYYNNNQQFIQAHLPASIIQESRIFEKEEIRWVCIDDLPQMMPKFRFFFTDIVKQILEQKTEIRAFLRSGKKTKDNNRSKRKTRKRA